MVALSIIWTGIPFTLFPLAEQHINSAVTGLLNGAVPMFTATFGLLFFGRRTNGPQLLGLAVGLAGVVLISLPSLTEGSSQALGVGLVVLATRVLRPGDQPGRAAPGPVRLPSRDGPDAGPRRRSGPCPSALLSVPDSHVELRPILAVVVLGIVGTGLAYLLMGTLVGRVGPTRASFITYLIPVVSLVLGVAFKDDHVAVLALAGVALVIVGAALASRQERGRNNVCGRFRSVSERFRPQTLGPWSVGGAGELEAAESGRGEGEGDERDEAQADERRVAVGDAVADEVVAARR